MPNDSDRQAVVRAITNTAYDYDGDWHALFDLASIPTGDFNGRFLQWANSAYGLTAGDVPGAMAAIAALHNVPNWSSLGSDFFIPDPANSITNWRGTGTGGTNGLPNGWSAAIVAGVTLSVLSRTPYRGGNIIEFQFTGTTSAAGGVSISVSGTYAAAAAQVWAFSVFAEPVGAQTPGNMDARIRFRDSGNVSLGDQSVTLLAGTIATGPTSSATATAPASTANAGLMIYRTTIPISTAVSIRYKVFAPSLVRVS